MGMEYFGDKLRALRMEKKLTQNDLAARLGIVGASVSSYEKSKQVPVCRGIDSTLPNF